MRIAACARRAAGALILAWVANAAQAAADGTAAERGEYVFRAAGCAACHTDADNGGAFLAGGRRFATPFGVFHSPNITPHREHGIGAWSEAEFVAAVREGVGPGGKHYYPVFPYPSYRLMRPADAADLYAYLMTVEAQATPNREHELALPFRFRFVNRVWKWLFLDRGEFSPEPQRSEQWNRGAYLVRALGHCGECHTPRNLLGVLDGERHLAGTAEGPDGEAIPNITPHRADGIGKWSVSDLRWYLETGGLPDGDFAGSLMAEVIDEGLSQLTDEDREAIAVYLKDLPPLPGPRKQGG